MNKILQQDLDKPWGLEFSQEEIEIIKAKNGLLSLELELSRKCNLRCIYCYAASGEALNNELSFNQICDVVKQAKDLGAKKIIVLGGGEPLLYPQLLELIEFINKNQLDIALFTNATLLTKKIAQKLYEFNVEVAIKLNSFRAPVQDLLAGKKNTFSLIMKGLKNLIQAGYPDKNHKLGVETIICKQNYEEIPKIWRWARKNSITPYIEIMTLQGRAKKHPELEVSKEEIRALFETLARIDNVEFNRYWLVHPPLVASHCARHEYSCTVAANGDVYPCPGVDIAVGNVRHLPLKTILKNSPIIQDLRNIRKNIKGKCAKCELKYRCYGCRGHAYQVTGDYLAQDPLCWIDQKNIKKDNEDKNKY